MKLALECPTRYLAHIQPFADFDWILAHKVLTDETYAQFYAKSGKSIRVLDNSVNELGRPMTVDEIKKAADIVHPTDIVAPDFLGDALETLKSYVEMQKANLGVPLIFVLQGRDPDDIFRSLEVYRQGTIAVPYDILSQKTDSPALMAERRALVVSQIPAGIPIHLLGFDTIDEFAWYKGRNVISVDTGVPVMLGLQGLDIMDLMEDKAKPTFEKMEKYELTQPAWTAVLRNLALLRRYIS